MNGWFILVLAILAYGAGSVPFGLLVGRLRGVDLREHGSRNIGATNAGRVLGLRFGILVFVLDFAKGLIPVLAARAALARADEASSWERLVPVIAAVAAIFGHIFPIFLRFRGGKGVATAAGAFAGCLPVATAVGLASWAIVLACSRWVALASVLAAWTFLAAVAFTIERADAASSITLSIAAAIALLITWRHRSNLGRMWRGEEPRIGGRNSSQVVP